MTGAIAREKQIKGESRAKKLALIEAMNPDWADLWEISHIREFVIASEAKQSSVFVCAGLPRRRVVLAIPPAWLRAPRSSQ